MSSHRRWDLAFLALILIGVLVPTLGFVILRDSNVALLESIEKRRAAPAPAFHWSFENVQRFPREFDAYFTDRLALRHQLIQLRNRIDFYIFQKSPAPMVTIGKDGWLFLNDQKSNDAFLGRTELATADLNRLRLAIEKRRDWLAQRGIAYVFVIAPDKQSIYPEKLPETLHHDGLNRRTQQFLDYMHGSSAENNIIFPAMTLKAAKGDAELYYHLDSHWNFHAGYVVYRETLERIERISTLRVGAAMMSAHSFSDGNAPNGPVGGDLAIMLNLRSGVGLGVKERPDFEQPTCAQAAEVAIVSNVSIWPQLDKAWACDSDLHNQNVLLFHDSFGTLLSPFYAAHFMRFRESPRRATFEDLVNYVEIIKPTIVIEEHVERLFWAPELAP